jgi:uncharacterized repeat protein (TIGR03809 family)
MTHREDVVRSRDIFARWRALAERRLDYLTELYETGRWRRFYSEASFLENIKEAKTAVEIWHDLAVREASRDNIAVNVAWLGRRDAAPSRTIARDDRVHHLVPQPAPIRIEAPLSDPSMDAAAGLAYFDGTPSAPDAEPPVLEQAFDLKTPDRPAIHERYPLLRNAL